MAQFLNIKKRTAKLPNGNTARLELVEHPGAVLIVPFLSRDKVILLRQFRPVINAYIFELPAGTLEKGEQPLACARREIIETLVVTKKMVREFFAAAKIIDAKTICAFAHCRWL